jgi:hypothetical protein
VAYEFRETDQAQSPMETLDRNQGSCRDFAVLFVDAVRSLGFGARIVSGYLYDPAQTSVGSEGPDQLMHGRKSMCPEPAGSCSILPIEVSVVSILFQLQWRATSIKRCPYRAVLSETRMISGIVTLSQIERNFLKTANAKAWDFNDLARCSIA